MRQVSFGGIRAALSLAMALGTVAVPAWAGLEICNDTDVEITMAIGYPEGEDWASEGWWTIAPAECGVVIEGDLTNRYYYFHAESSRLGWGTQGFMFCTTDDEFTIVGSKDCEARGYETTEFDQLDTGETVEYTLHMTMPPREPEADADDPMMLGAATAVGALPLSTPGLDPTLLLGHFETKLGSQTVEISLPPPGAKGDPYKVFGLLSHCDRVDDRVTCEVHVDGWRFVAASDEHTPIFMLAEMIKLEVNTPIAISGDVVSHEGNEARVLIRNFKPVGGDVYGNARANLQGGWQSPMDLEHQLHVRGSVVEERKGDTVERHMLGFARTCPGMDREGTALVLTPFDDPQTPQCLMIDGFGSMLVLDAARVVFKRME